MNLIKEQYFTNPTSMRMLVSALAMSAGLLLTTISTHAHTQPHRPKNMHVLQHLAKAAAYYEVSPLPALLMTPPTLPVE